MHYGNKAMHVHPTLLSPLCSSPTTDLVTGSPSDYSLDNAARFFRVGIRFFLLYAKERQLLQGTNYITPNLPLPRMMLSFIPDSFLFLAYM